MGEKTITFITLHDNTLRDIMKQCYELGIMDDFNVEGRTITQLAYQPITASSLIVVSSDRIIPTLKLHCPESVHIIVAKRTINYANLRSVLDVPRGVKTLLVNDSKERAIDTIELLKNVGIQLDFYPFYPGMTSYPEDIVIAVTPGEANLVPSTIAKVIDIGSRIIDISTWIEISAYFHYEAPDLSKLAAQYICSVVYITQELSREIQKTHLLHKHLEVIVNRIDDGVLAIDEQDIVRIVNDKALAILKQESQQVIGQTASECIQAYFYQLIYQLPFETEEVLNWENQSFFFRKTHIVIEGKNYGFLVIFRRASEINKLEHDYRRKQMSKGLVAKYMFHDLLGVSASFKKLCHIAKQMAKGNSTILLLGETGTGKELLAQAIHNVSLRQREPFVGVNFAAISESLLESELFGYEEGAFTGAKKGGHIGLFEQAHKGTIFLDEIGDASAAIQNRLLRVLQEREIMKVGGNRIIPVDIRVIAATNRNLQEMVQSGQFRSDLYYRLNVLPVYVPPLRDRKEDIPVLAQNFIVKFCRELQRPVFRFSQEAMNCMLSYDWLGNIRELENVIQYLAHVVEEVVSPQHLLFNKESSRTVQDSVGMERDWELLCQSYVAKGFMDDIKVILQIIRQAQRAVGRNYVMNQLQDKGWNMTEQQLRYRMQLLKQDGFIEVGRARQGSTITSKGVDLLHYFLK
ncbi:transcriptional regulator with PAS [Sporomusaceae bacterium BoRhaA]|uniref:sigma 54-interacting transcriptional regulator n=1 Tax=Pelorhabdus rhamnosifermentans TaxID=2772457 RepID=UPI001C05F7A1|nr:sigma 54-interacting transcriptional regulator [Pelorhabdus rhamnosifermentans]MBU2700785.1 transcriptional regulator with PAS [Pelorhabdus rhamnosifermentans]